jgi:hypothetical protein
MIRRSVRIAPPRVRVLNHNAVVLLADAQLEEFLLQRQPAAFVSMVRREEVVVVEAVVAALLQILRRQLP